ncbi:MAG TPA: Maf family protein [Candidatus Acidoferrales bacterium]|nr:Maf family protein [Candidatus Acidoferrales bacterium]
MKIILASASPRRAEVLRAAGFEFSVMPAEIDETPNPGEGAVELVERLALLKARAVAGKLRQPDAAVVLGADTVVMVDGEILGKPHTFEMSVTMLRKLQGRWHEVITGVALLGLNSAHRGVSATEEMVEHETTRVQFSRMTDTEIEEYARSVEPLDKAGAYAIQGRAARFIPRIEGCYFNVVGLPVALITRMLARLRDGER